MMRLTETEKKAIKDLEALAARWPESLLLFSWSGSLTVIKNRSSDYQDYKKMMEDQTVATIYGIPNDGGCP